MKKLSSLLISVLFVIAIFSYPSVYVKAESNKADVKSTNSANIKANITEPVTVQTQAQIKNNEKSLPAKGRPPLPATSSNIQVREQLKERMQAKNAILDSLKNSISQSKEAFEQKKAEIKAQIEQKQQELRQQIETKREEIKAQIEAKKAELKDKLAKIRSEEKKQVVEKIYENINELNTRLTNHYLDVLNRLEKVLSNISSRTVKAEANGLDVTAVKTAITEATNAIESARSAIKSQAGKIYSINISSESNLKNDVGKARQTLQKDLKTVFEDVKKAQEAVKKAATTLAKIPNINNIEGSTTTPQQ